MKKKDHIKNLHKDLMFPGSFSLELKIAKLSELFDLLQKNIPQEHIQYLSSTEKIALCNQELYKILNNPPKHTNFLARVVKNITSELQSIVNNADIKNDLYRQEYTGILKEITGIETTIDIKLTTLQELFVVLKNKVQEKKEYRDDIDGDVYQRFHSYSKLYHEMQGWPTHEDTFLHAIAKVAEDFNSIVDRYNLLYQTKYMRGKKKNMSKKYDEVSYESREGLQDRRRKMIKKHYPLEVFLESTSEQKKYIEINGKKLGAITSIFDVSGSPIVSSANMRNLAEKIYGSKEVYDYNIWEKQLWRKIIKKNYSLHQFLMMKPGDKHNININKHSLTDIARIFDIKGNPILKGVTVDMANEIYTSQRVEAYLEGKRYMRGREESPTGKGEYFKEEIKRQYSLEKFLTLTAKRKRELTINGMSLYRIASVLEIESNPNESTKNMLDLAVKIYGEEEVRAYNIDWKESIKKEYTVERFIMLTDKEKASFMVHGKNLQSFCYKANIVGNPLQSKHVMLKLAQEIYGSKAVEIGVQSKMEQERQTWRDAIKNQYTVDMFVDLKGVQKVRVQGKTLLSIAKIFGIQGDDMNNENLLKLTKEIYGNNVVESYVNAYRIATRELYSKEEFLKLHTGFRIKGKGLRAIATVFGFKNFNRLTNEMQELANKIYDRDIKIDDNIIE